MNAENSSTLHGLIQETGFHVCIGTSDFERSVNFYEALGFTSENQIQVKQDTFRMHYMFHAGCNATVEIIFHSDKKQACRLDVDRKDILGINHFGFHVRDLNRVRTALQSLGAPIVEDSSRGAYDFIFAKGPDGELISFAQFKRR